MVSSSNDHNIHLTRFIDGVHIGQFGQDSMWNIHDLSAFNSRLPKYTRSWVTKMKKQRREGRKKTVGFRSDVKGGAGTLTDEGSMSPSRSPVRKITT